MTNREINTLLGHKLIGSEFLKTMVVRALQKLPDNIVSQVVKTTWFVGSFTDGWAFTLRGDELKKNEHLVFLSDELLAQDEKQIIWSILHEIGHVVLGHRNSIAEIQSKKQIRIQEKEADEFAGKALSYKP